MGCQLDCERSMILLDKPSSSLCVFFCFVCSLFSFSKKKKQQYTNANKDIRRLANVYEDDTVKIDYKILCHWHDENNIARERKQHLHFIAFTFAHSRMVLHATKITIYIDGCSEWMIRFVCFGFICESISALIPSLFLYRSILNLCYVFHGVVLFLFSRWHCIVREFPKNIRIPKLYYQFEPNW